MNSRLAPSCLVAAAPLLPAAGHGADSVRSSATAYVDNAVIPTKINDEQAVESLSSLEQFSVETDNKGIIALRGTVNSKNVAEKAVAIARSVNGVISAENHLEIVAKINGTTS